MKLAHAPLCGQRLPQYQIALGGNRLSEGANVSKAADGAFRGYGARNLACDDDFNARISNALQHFGVGAVIGH